MPTRYNLPLYSGPYTRAAATLSDLPRLNAQQQADQQSANLGRIPEAGPLEAKSSADIMALLNPPSMFPDTSRHAAELAAIRGIPGSPAAASTAVRMTDEERLRRIGLGQQFLSAALARNPAAPLINPAQFMLTPYQAAQLDLENRRLRLGENEASYQDRIRATPSVTYSGGVGGIRTPDLRAPAYTTYPGSSPTYTGSTHGTGFPDYSGYPASDWTNQASDLGLDPLDLNDLSGVDEWLDSQVGVQQNVGQDTGGDLFDWNDLGFYD